MRIAIYSDFFYPELSGVADSILATGSLLAKMGHTIEYFVPDYSPEDYAAARSLPSDLELDKNIKIHRLPSLPIKTPAFEGRFAFPTLTGIFSKEKFDIIHSHSFSGPGLEAWLRAKKQKTVFIGTNHTQVEAFSPVNIAFVKRLLGRYVAWYYNRCDLVSVPSKFLISDMQCKGFSRPTKVVSNPITSDFYVTVADKQLLKKELGLDSFTVLYAGRLSGEKNIEILLKAFASFAEKMPGTDLVIAGGGPLRRQLENMVRGTPVEDRIKFRGPFLGKNKKTYYELFRASDVFVMPSKSETQSMGVIQAMAAGLPVIVSRVGALPEIVGSDRGLIFEDGDDVDLCHKLLDLYNDKEKRNIFSENGKKYAGDFAEEKIAQLWEKIYEEAAKS